MNCGLLLCVCVSPRQLLKTELGSFFTEYLQNQLLTKGMVILRDKIHFYEGTGEMQRPFPSSVQFFSSFCCEKNKKKISLKGPCLHFNDIK